MLKHVVKTLKTNCKTREMAKRGRALKTQKTNYEMRDSKER